MSVRAVPAADGTAAPAVQPHHGTPAPAAGRGWFDGLARTRQVSRARGGYNVTGCVPAAGLIRRLGPGPPVRRWRAGVGLRVGRSGMAAVVAAGRDDRP